MSEEFKVGDIIECTEDIHGITLGKIYIVLEDEDEDEELVYISNDYGNEEYYFSYRFKKVSSPVFPVNAQGGVKDIIGKLRWTLLPWKALKEVVNVLEYGSKKYSDNNWQKVEPYKYKDAAFRHWLAYIEGEKLDPETGYSHLAHLACDVLFLLWFEVTGKADEKSPS